MRWLPRLLSHAAAAGRRIPATSHGFASGGRAPGARAAAEVLVRSENQKRRSDAAKRSRRPAVAEAVVVRSEEPKMRRRDAAAKRPRRQRAVSGVGEVSLGGLASAARSFVNSKVAALGGSFVRAWRAAGKADAPSTSCRHGEELDLARVQAKLKPLLSRVNLIITRQVGWANILFGFQQKTRYIIKDPRTPRRKTPVGLIQEKSNLILRQLLRSRRPYVAEFTDHRGKEIFTVCRPFRWINSSIYAEVDGKEIGVVHSRWHLWRRIYDLYLGNRRFAVAENPGFWSWTFTLLDENDNVVAKIDRKARGIGLELFRDAGKYEIVFGDVGMGLPVLISRPEDMGKLGTLLPLALPERAVALALAVSVDHDYFSRRLAWGNTIFRGRWRRRAARPTSPRGRRPARRENRAEDEEEELFWAAASTSSSTERRPGRRKDEEDEFWAAVSSDEDDEGDEDDGGDGMDDGPLFKKIYNI